VPDYSISFFPFGWSLRSETNHDEARPTMLSQRLIVGLTPLRCAKTN